MSTSLRRRLLNDLKEFREKPYPGITLHVHDEDITTACLVIQTGPYGLLHMSVSFDGYPIKAPRVKMNSTIEHPNVFDDYICASVLKDDEGYTSAYTLMGIALQILSFFNADRVEQDYGGTVDMARFHQYNTHNPRPTYYCAKCLFGGYGYTPPAMDLVAPSLSDVASPSSMAKSKQTKITQLPAEVILNICENLETKDIISFGNACPKVFAVSTDSDVIRIREMNCFCLKQGYKTTMLGVGVSIPDKGNNRFFESEFDLLSYEAFHTHRIRRSVQGVPFGYWLPLPISNGHWTKINYAVESKKQSETKADSHVGTSSDIKTVSKIKAKSYVETSLETLASAANLGVVKPEQVLYHMMNDVAVKLNKDIDSTKQTPEEAFYWLMVGRPIPAKSALTHASEKAIESYFHLFHFLLCMATADPQIVTRANKALDDFFVKGLVAKSDCKNLGHLLVASLLSSKPMTLDIKRAIVGEAITRNVVFMLNKKPGLAYLEPSVESTWRLKETFTASLASYRIIMFQNLFREHAIPQPSPQQVPGQAVPQSSLEKLKTLRDQAFERHGAPPPGVAQTLAAGIKKIHQVETFTEFFKEMGIPQPDKANFTKFLRNCIRDSEAKGYHRAVLTQAQALYRRLTDEPDIERSVAPSQPMGNFSFFPGSGTGRGGYPSNQRGGGGYGRGRGGHGRGRGGNYRGRGGQ